MRFFKWEFIKRNKIKIFLPALVFILFSAPIIFYFGTDRGSSPHKIRSSVLPASTATAPAIPNNVPEISQGDLQSPIFTNKPSKNFGRQNHSILSPQAGGIPKLIFSLGPEADGAEHSRLNKEAPLGMYTSWYNGTKDLSWMRHWKTTLIPRVYQSGRAHHLIVFDPGPETGAPCGKQYPISSQINADMVELAQIFAGGSSGPPLYVTLFTEFQTYPCHDNTWSEATEYYNLLKSKMIEIRNIFRSYAPNSKVSIGWGGWQARWDDPGKGGGRSLFPHFDDVMRQMDFQSFQAMQDNSNVEDVRNMTNILRGYGPVMLAHHKPDGFHPHVFLADLKTMMTDSFLAEITSRGLFAWSFMDGQELASSEEIFNLVKTSVLRYGRFP